MSGRKGLAIVTFSLAASVLVPFAGLAIDGAVLCVVKERLAAAVDSAAAAAGRYPQGSPKVESTAQRFLDANFPQGHMGSGTRKVTIEGNTLTVRIEAQTYFLRLIHVRNVEVVAAHRIVGS
ncbi:MAG TPA: hypothetical protein VGL53_08150 [Bryobacteraceae bacterium]|jgi:Flp pilus assembly protein TadG